MKINGVWSEEGYFRKDIACAFQAPLSNPIEWRVNIQGLNFSRIPDMEVASLELPFSTEEVLAAPRDMTSDKALGLNGFTTTFWQSSWEVEKDCHSQRRETGLGLFTFFFRHWCAQVL